MTAVIDYIVKRWIKFGIIDEANEDIYVYGLDLILFSILNLIVIFVTAAFFGWVMETAILMATIVPLQAYGGGYHAKTHLRCFVIMYVGWWAAMLALPFLSSLIATVSNIIAIVVIFILAPVSHENVKMSPKQRLKMQRYVRIAVAIIAVISFASIWLIQDDSRTGIILAIGIGLSAFSMLVAQCLERISKNR
jgi:accessory gene regulator B